MEPDTRDTLTLIGSQVAAFAFAFVPSLTLHRYLTRRHSWRVRTSAVLGIALGIVLWLLLVAVTVSQETAHRREARSAKIEREWVTRRAAVLDRHIRGLILEAKDIRTALLDDTVRSGMTLERFRHHEKRAGAWRDRAEEFLEREFPCTALGTPYDFGIGHSREAWVVAQIDGTVRRLLTTLTDLPNTIARSCFPRSPEPQLE